MKITEIKQQQKRQDRYSIYVDGKYVFSFSELELMNSGVRVGREVTPQELEELKERASEDKAYDRALNYLALRQRSEWEVREYLRRKDYASELAEKIVARLNEKKLIDDAAFARSWTESRRMLKPISKRKLRLELQQKHIDRSVIDQVLADDETDERAVLRGLVAKKRRLSRYQDEQKLMQYLIRQGFSYEDVRSVLRESEEG